LLLQLLLVLLGDQIPICLNPLLLLVLVGLQHLVQFCRHSLLTLPDFPSVSQFSLATKIHTLLFWQISNQQPKSNHVSDIRSKNKHPKGQIYTAFLSTAKTQANIQKLFSGKYIFDYDFFRSRPRDDFEQIACLARTKIKQLAENEKAGW